MKDDPDEYVLCMPKGEQRMNKFIRVRRAELDNKARDYKSTAVEEQLSELGEYEYNDKASLQMLADIGYKSIIRED